MAERARVDANPSRHKPWATFSVLWSHLGFVICKMGKLHPPSRSANNEHLAEGLGMESPVHK